MIDRLKNCPNCGGIIDDVGRCRFCGAKIYDFVHVDFGDNKPTYIRIRTNTGRIVTMPIRFITCRVRINPIYADECLREDGMMCPKLVRNDTRIELEAYSVGDIIYEEEKKNDFRS